MESRERPRRVVIYARVSNARHESRSVPQQLDELRGWAQRESWVIVEECSDEVSASAYSKRARPGWERVMEIIRSGDVDALLLWETSRAARDNAVFSALTATCIEAGVKIGKGGRLYDPSDGDDGFVLDLESALAVRESRMTSKRVRRDVSARVVKGTPNGALPYGYRRILSPETGLVISREIDPVTGPVVREIVRRVLAREALNSIAADLNVRGIPTSRGSQWRSSDIRQLVLRPALAALRSHKGEIQPVAASWPAIISVEDHHRLVALFADPDRDKWRNSTNVKHLGSGLFVCGICSATMRVVAGPYRYECSKCHRVTRRQARVDEAVERLMIARLQMPDVLSALAPDDRDARAAADEVVRLTAKLTEARQLVDDEKMSLASFADFEARWLPQIAAAEQKSRPKFLPAQLVDMAGGDAERRWRGADVKTRRVVLDALATVTILTVGASRKPFDPNVHLRVDWKGQH